MSVFRGLVPVNLLNGEDSRRMKAGGGGCVHRRPQGVTREALAPPPLEFQIDDVIVKNVAKTQKFSIAPLAR